MVVITGGAWQGMNEYAMRLAVENARIVDCRENTDAVYEADVILNLQDLVGRLIKEKKDPYEMAEELLRKNPNAIVTIQEMGCGIVPMDAYERDWREFTGRISCILAREATEVYRVICGIESRLKP